MAGKYTPFEKYLRDLPETQKGVTLSLDQIETLIRSRLPSSAYGYSQWWAHETEGNRLNARAWTNAGWKIKSLSLEQEWVKLVRGK